LTKPKVTRASRKISSSQWIRDRCQKWRNGQWREVLNETLLQLEEPTNLRRKRFECSEVLSKEEAQRLYNKHRCVKLAALGRYGDAIKALTSTGVAEITPAVIDDLLAKHPQIPPVNLPQAAQPPISLIATPKQVADALSSFKNGSSPGASGLRPEHLKEAWNSKNAIKNQRFMELLTNFVNAMLRGDVPAEIRPYIAGAPVIPLAKKDGGIRPIAIGEIFRRLVSKIANFHAMSRTKEYFARRQFGVGIKTGAEAILHGVNATVDHYRDDPSKIMFKVDLRNAFNLVDRVAFINAIRERVPDISAWVECCYQSQAYLWCGDNEFRSCQGVQQGDPLGPLLFSLVLQKIVLEIDQACPDLIINAWYLDDGTFIGSVDSVLRALEIIETRGPQFGLFLNLSKCEVWWPSSDNATLSRFPPAVQHVFGDGIALLGGPVGGPEITRAMWATRLAKIETLCGELDNLNNAQVQLCLLRSCVGFPKINFALRTCNPLYLQADLADFDAIMQRSLSCIANCEVSGDALMQCHLPISNGGLGIPSAQELSSVAFLSSLHQSASLQKSMIADETVIIPRSCSADLLANYNDKFSAELPVIAANLNDASSSQRMLSQRVHNKNSQALLQRLDTTDLARLRSVSGPQAGDWLRVVPIPIQGLTMSTREYAAAVRIHLGLPNIPEEQTCSVCNRAQMDKKGFHALSCSSGGIRIMRHNAICDILFHNMRSAFLAPQLEVTGLFTDNRRADIVVPLWQGKRCAFDVTIPSPVCASNVQVASTDPEEFLQSKVQEKNDKYAQDLAAIGYAFKPLVVDAFGQMHPEFVKVVKEVARRRANHLGEEERAMVQVDYLLQRIGFTLRKAVACSIVERSI
jgi:hypothetical protein